MSLFRKIYEVSDLQNLKKCTIVLEELLKEVGEITDITAQTNIDTLLELEDKSIKISFLKLLVKYWRVYSKNYLNYRNTLEEISPYFNLLLSLKEDDEQKFVNDFPRYLQYVRRTENYQNRLMDDCNDLLLMVDNNRKATAILVNAQAVDDSGRCADEDYSNFVRKLVQNGSYIGNISNNKLNPSDLNRNWIEADAFKKYLDSRVTGSLDENHVLSIKIDYSFLIDPETRTLFECKSKIVDKSLFFNESIKPLEMILENERLTHLVTHPVISLYTHIMSYKYQRIYNINLIAFLLIFVLPF